MMRAYLITEPSGEDCVVFIAETAKEAKKMSFGHDVVAECDYIDIRVRWQKGKDVSGLAKGEVDLLEGLKRGMYTFVYGVACPHCGHDEYANKIYADFCDKCEGKLVEESTR